MGKTIYFSTSNHGKLVTCRKHLAPLGYEVMQCDLEIIEPQADTVESVSVAKAEQAFAQLGHSLIVHDSGFCLDAFGGFPGPYTKYVLDKLGVEGVLSLLGDQQNRKYRFVQALTFVDDNGAMVTFSESDHVGLVDTKVDPFVHPDDWSSLWQICIPEGHDKTLNHVILSNDKKFTNRQKSSSVFAQLARWLEENKA